LSQLAVRDEFGEVVLGMLPGVTPNAPGLSDFVWLRRDKADTVALCNSMSLVRKSSKNLLTLTLRQP
jgi:hypothetical protein